VITAGNVDDLMARTARKTLREVEAIVACLAPRPDVKGTIRKMPERAVPERKEPELAPPPCVQLTVSSETRATIERAQALMKHRNPSGDLEVVFDRAMDALIEKLEKERLRKTTRPQKKARPAKPGTIPAEVWREVFARDGEACTHVDEHGNRCGCRDFLELDHIIPRAKGGTDEASNLRVVCRSHNRRYAEQAFGDEYVAKRIEESRSRPRRRPGNDNESGELVPDRK